MEPKSTAPAPCRVQVFTMPLASAGMGYPAFSAFSEKVKTGYSNGESPDILKTMLVRGNSTKAACWPEAESADISSLESADSAEKRPVLEEEEEEVEVLPFAAAASVACEAPAEDANAGAGQSAHDKRDSKSAAVAKARHMRHAQEAEVAACFIRQ